jgi:hypothetical protein
VRIWRLKGYIRDRATPLTLAVMGEVRRLLYLRGVCLGFYLMLCPFLSVCPILSIRFCRGEGRTSKNRPLPAMKSVSPVKTAFDPSCSRK